MDENLEGLVTTKSSRSGPALLALVCYLAIIAVAVVAVLYSL